MLITGASSGFGRELTRQLLERGDVVIGTVRQNGKVPDFVERYPTRSRAKCSNGLTHRLFAKLLIARSHVSGALT
ncbi:MAG: hypothetical protein WB776_12535 [Candidatus Sulfotelmatobacter sp.]